MKITDVETFIFSAAHHNANRNWVIVKINTDDGQYGLGDASGTGNAKTAAAVRKQAPVVADNLLAVLDGKPMRSSYAGYGACPLTVERGRVVLAEFGYGGQLQPTFPSWINQPSPLEAPLPQAPEGRFIFETDPADRGFLR